MPTHAEKRKLPYTQEQLFRLVAEVERYPDFLPWCLGSRIRKREGNVFWADLVIGFKVVRERFTSKVTLSAPNRVDVEYTDGPFKYLNNKWTFEKDNDCSLTCIDKNVDFEFSSMILQTIIFSICD